MKKGISWGVGSACVLMVFVVLCLVTFGVLAYSTARADLALAQRNAQAVAARYCAEGRGAELVSQTKALAGDEWALATFLSQSGGTRTEQGVEFTVSATEQLDLYIALSVAQGRAELEKWRFGPSEKWREEQTLDVWLDE